jgi:hypothetical protein
MRGTHITAVTSIGAVLVALMFLIAFDGENRTPRHRPTIVEGSPPFEPAACQPFLIGVPLIRPTSFGEAVGKQSSLSSPRETFRYDPPPEGVTVQQLVSDASEATGRRIRLSECVSLSSRKIRFFQPGEVPASQTFEFFRTVLAVYEVDLVTINELPGDDLLAEFMDSSGSRRARARFPFLQAEALERFAYDDENIVAVAIPRGTLGVTELQDVLRELPRNLNREGYMLGTAFPWVIGFAHPATAFSWKVAIENAERERPAPTEEIPTQSEGR